MTAVRDMRPNPHGQEAKAGEFTVLRCHTDTQRMMLILQRQRK